MTAALFLASSCSLFLEKPDTTGTVDQEAVFSTTKNARAALMSCYRNVLRHAESILLKCLTQADRHFVIGAYYCLRKFSSFRFKLTICLFTARIPEIPMEDHIVLNP